MFFTYIISTALYIIRSMTVVSKYFGLVDHDVMEVENSIVAVCFLVLLLGEWGWRFNSKLFTV